MVVPTDESRFWAPTVPRKATKERALSKNPVVTRAPALAVVTAPPPIVPATAATSVVKLATAFRRA